MNYNRTKKQRGAALITALLVVFVISILGVAVAQQVIVLRKVSTANYDYMLSQNNADSALAAAQDVIVGNFLDPVTMQSLSIDLITTANWWHTDSNWDDATALTDVTGNQPVYLVEDAGTNGSLMLGTNAITQRFYRITIKAQGKGEATSFLQSYYATLE